MAIINLGVRGDSSSVYELMTIIDIKGCDGNIIYEIHNQEFNENVEPNEEFVKRTKDFYKAFINPGFVDQWACNEISYAAKVDNLWYFAVDTGSNTYLGTGPTSTIRLREYCVKKSLRILYIESSIEKWKREIFSDINPIIEIEKPEIINEAQSYKAINIIIKRLGDGICQTIKTAAKLNENNYRDLFLCGLKTHNNYNVTAESNYRDGRTDLLILDRQLEIPFIFEFKIHKNNNDIAEGLNQIIKQYPTVQNKFNGLVLINLKTINLFTLAQNIESSLNETGFPIKEIIKEQDEQKIIVKHKHIRDERINCILTIYVFDIQN